MATSTDVTDDDCPICLCNFNDPVKTPCGHKFCANCILTYWETNWQPGACYCPYCRLKVRMLIPNNVTVTNRSAQQKINEYNATYGNQPVPFITHARESPVLLRHMFRELVSFGGLSFCNRLWIILMLMLALVYLISPIDLIPELILGLIGYIDDIASIIAALLYIAHMYRSDMARRTV